MNAALLTVFIVAVLSGPLALVYGQLPWQTAPMMSLGFIAPNVGLDGA